MLIEIGQLVEPRRLSPGEERQLLRAALQIGPDACKEAVSWLSHADIESMSFNSLRLMPQLYDRLRSEEIGHPLLPRLKGLKKYAWSKNQLLFHRTGDAICALQQAGIDAMVIKGMAMIVGYYRDFSLRPMYDADLLVPRCHARRAVQILARHGWTSEYEDPQNRRRSDWAFQHEHAAHLYDPLKRDLDLHWNLLMYRIGQDVDEDFWAASREVSFYGKRVRILNPADQLLHICVHGTNLSPVCWIPDALAVLRSTPNLDWNRLLLQARKRNLVVMVAKALHHVQRDFADLVPSETMMELQRSHVPIFERYEYRQLTTPESRLFGCLHQTICKFLRLSNGMSLPDKVHLFPEFFCFHWKVARKRELPAAFWRKARNKIIRYFRGRSRRVGSTPSAS